MEQEQTMGETEAGVPIGMEAAQRKLINTAATKHVAAMARAIEMQYQIEYVYAIDGSADKTEARGDGGATEEKAAAWGSWDGIVARGGALPPGTGNQITELVGIERTLHRHKAGDRVLLLCDCQSAMQMTEADWRCGELGEQAAMQGRTGSLTVEAITRHRLRISEKGENGQQGCVAIMWVKAHGGGVAPNAYADAIAKSHLAEPPQDVPLETMLPQACVYAVATEPDTGAEKRRTKDGA